MLIRRVTSKHGNLAPCAVNYFKNLPDRASFHAEQQLRHPASIYSMSLEKLGKAFDRVAGEYFQKSEDCKNDLAGELPVTNLVEYQESFLRAAQEHLDDCYLVLKCLVDPAKVKKSPIFADRYVIENGLPGAKYFHEATVDLKKSFRIANKLKHQQGRLRGMGIWLPSQVNLGFFLEEPDKDGHLAPSEEIHPGRSATSFAYDLPWRMARVYVCSEKLVKAVRTAVSSLHGQVLSESPQSLASWGTVVRNLVKFSPSIFPKEMNRGIARFVENDGSLEIRGPLVPNIRFPRQMNVRLETFVDGYSRSFKVPFP